MKPDTQGECLFRVPVELILLQQRVVKEILQSPFDINDSFATMFSGTIFRRVTHCWGNSGVVRTVERRRTKCMHIFWPIMLPNAAYVALIPCAHFLNHNPFVNRFMIVSNSEMPPVFATCTWFCNGLKYLRYQCVFTQKMAGFMSESGNISPIRAWCSYLHFCYTGRDIKWIWERRRVWYCEHGRVGKHWKWKNVDWVHFYTCSSFQ